MLVHNTCRQLSLPTAHKQRFNTHNNQTKRLYQSKAPLNGRDFKKVVMLLQGETTENENNNIKTGPKRNGGRETAAKNVTALLQT